MRIVSYCFTHLPVCTATSVIHLKELVAYYYFDTNFSLPKSGPHHEKKLELGTV